MQAHQGPVRGSGGAPALPVPAAWTGRQMSVSFIAAMVGLTLLVLGMVVGAVPALRSGDAGAVVLLTVGAVFLAHVVGFSVQSRRVRTGGGRPPRSVHEAQGGRGVRFGYATASYHLLGALLVVSMLLTAAVAVLAMFGGPVGVLLGVALAALAVALGWFLVTMLRLAPGELVLSPAGISHRSLVHTQFVPWRDVYQVSAETAHTPCWWSRRTCPTTPECGATPAGSALSSPGCCPSWRSVPTGWPPMR